MIKTMELYDMSHTLADGYLKEFEYPWQALAGIKALILELGPKLGDEFTQVAPEVWVHKTAKVAQNTERYIGNSRYHIYCGNIGGPAHFVRDTTF